MSAAMHRVGRPDHKEHAMMNSTESKWQPLIADEQRRSASATVIAEIVAAIRHWRLEHATTRDEDADYSLLRFYTAMNDIVPDPQDEGGDALGQAVSRLEDCDIPGLFGGAARIAFTVGHVGVGADAALACDMIEQALLVSLAQPTQHYDLITGLVGIAVPVLQRIADGKPSPSTEPLAYKILEHLELLACPMDTGLAWHTPRELLISPRQRALTPDGHFNLGLAHGIPGIVAILSRYLAAGVAPTRARVLLEGAIAYLRSVAGPEAGKRYPQWLPPRFEGSTWMSPVSWCYGDLGVALSFMSAAIAIGREDWRDDALALARGAAARVLAAPEAIDPALCHGTAGIAHLLNRLSHATGDAELSRAADRSYTRTLAMRRNEPIAGFPKATAARTWKPDATLLSGATGVALALHAAISAIEPAWDRLLLADVPPLGAPPFVGVT
jgi:lantibiotic modifying enzyme